MLGSLGSEASGSRAADRSVVRRFLTSLSLGTAVTAVALVVLREATHVRPATVEGAVLASLALIPLAIDVTTGRVLQSRWQVPEHWRRIVDPGILPVLYGLLLGLGFLNAVVLSAYWTFVVLSVLVSLPAFVAGWCAYAGVRAIGFYILFTRGRAGDGFATGLRPLRVAGLLASVFAVAAVWMA